MRNNYLHTGGHDANLLAHYTDVEYQLRTYENYPWTKDYPEPLKQARCKSISMELSHSHMNRSSDLDRTNNHHPPPPPPLDPTTEQIKLANEENFLLQAELEDIHQKYDKLDQRNNSFSFLF